jgi:hypothetical protein
MLVKAGKAAVLCAGLALFAGRQPAIADTDPAAPQATADPAPQEPQPAQPPAGQAPAEQPPAGSTPAAPQAPAGTQAPAQSPAEAPPKSHVIVGEDLGGGNGVSFSSSSGDFSLRLGFWGQFKFQMYDKDQWRRTNRNISTAPIPVENIGETQETFDVPRLRLYLSGNAFKPWLTYRLESDLVANDEGLREVFIPPCNLGSGANCSGIDVRAGSETQDGRTVKLVDFYLDGAPLVAAGFRLGQFKVPYSRQELVSDPRLQMTTRSIASQFFAPGRDRGIVLKGATPNSQRIGYQVGAFNGTGLTGKNNLDSTLAYDFRLTLTSQGPYLDIESLIDAPADRFHAQGGVSWYNSRMRTLQSSDPTSLIGDIQDRRVAADLQLFWHRHANLLMEYYAGNIKVDDSIQNRMQFICFGAFNQGLLTCDQKGYYVQGGATIGERSEVSGRYSLVDADRDLDRDRQIEATLNYTYFFRRHALRWSTSLTSLTLEVNGPGSSGLAVQLGDASIPTISPFPNPAAFPGLDDDHNHLLITQLQWAF